MSDGKGYCRGGRMGWDERKWAYIYFLFQNGKKVEEMEETCSCKGTFWSSVLSIFSMFSFINYHVKGDWCLLLQKSLLENTEAQVYTFKELHACRNLHEWLTGHMHLFALLFLCYFVTHSHTHTRAHTHVGAACFPNTISHFQTRTVLLSF